MNKEILVYLNMQRMHKLLKIRSTLFSSQLHYSSKKQTHYEALGVRQNATHNEIKAAYYELSLQCHPDKDASTGAKERFQAISTAYEVLGNHGLRRKYDMQLKTTHGSVYTVEEQVFTVNNQNQPYIPLDKVYDFDAWHREHYENALNKQKARKQKYEEYKETRFQAKHIDPTIPAVITTVILAIFAVFSHFYYSDSPYDTSLPKENKKPEKV